jgi:ribosomal protein S10
MNILLKINLKSYKRELFVYCLNILKKDLTFNYKESNKKTSSYRYKNKISTKQMFMPMKTKIHKYTMLRATHEFKYSWEKYLECIYNTEYRIILNKNKFGNTILSWVSKIIQTRKQDNDLRNIIKKSKLLISLSGMYTYKLYKKKYNYNKYSIFPAI